MDFNIPEDLKMVQTLVRDFVKDQLLPLEKEVLGRETDLAGARQTLPPETEEKLVKMVKDMGLWGIGIPEELGGIGLGTLGTCLVEEELAKTVVPFNFGDVTPILFDCNEKQKKDYLIPVIEGQKHPYLALIEPGKGADPAAMEMRAEKVNGNYLLSGRKISFSRSTDGDFAIVFAVTSPESGLRNGVTCFLVDSGTSGFTVTRVEEKTGWRAQMSEPVSLIFKDCRVAAEKVLGEEGKAFSLGSKWLPSRRIVRGARTIGAAVRLLDVATEQAKSWENFGKTISSSPKVEASLADMAIDIHAARLMVYHAASKSDEGADIRQEAAMVKVFATEMLYRVADRAGQIHGGPWPARELPLEVLCQNIVTKSAGQRALEVQKAIVTGNILKLGSIM